MAGFYAGSRTRHARSGAQTGLGCADDGMVDRLARRAHLDRRGGDLGGHRSPRSRFDSGLDRRPRLSAARRPAGLPAGRSAPAAAPAPALPGAERERLCRASARSSGTPTFRRTSRARCGSRRASTRRRSRRRRRSTHYRSGAAAFAAIEARHRRRPASRPPRVLHLERRLHRSTDPRPPDRARASRHRSPGARGQRRRRRECRFLQRAGRGRRAVRAIQSAAPRPAAAPAELPLPPEDRRGRRRGRLPRRHERLRRADGRRRGRAALARHPTAYRGGGRALAAALVPRELAVLDSLPHGDRARSTFPGQPRGDHWLQIVRGGPDRAVFPIHEFFFTAIAGADERIWITCPYLVPDEATLLAIRSAAHRGVDVRLLVPIRGDSRLVAAAVRSYYDDWLACGARVFEYGPAMLHAKTMVVDRELAVVGSANVDNRSFRLNFEIVAAIYGEEAADSPGGGVRGGSREGPGGPAARPRLAGAADASWAKSARGSSAPCSDGRAPPSVLARTGVDNGY